MSDESLADVRGRRLVGQVWQKALWVKVEQVAQVAEQQMGPALDFRAELSLGLGQFERLHVEFHYRFELRDISPFCCDLKRKTS